MSTLREYGYNPIKYLGSGTFGLVSLCQHADGKLYCVKRVRRISHREMDLIEHEIYILHNVKHPNIVEFFTYFYDQRDVYLVMENCKCGLDKLLAIKKQQQIIYSQEEVLHFQRDLIMGLEYLHLKKIIHRDLKTENILVDNNGRLKIADFGISVIQSSLHFRDSKQQGSLLYMAPESIIFNEHSAYTDIWAMGCIFYEICMLNHPFHNATCTKHVLDCIQLWRTKRKNWIRPEYVTDMEIMINGMMQYEPKRRLSVAAIISHPLICPYYYLTSFKLSNDIFYILKLE